MEKIELTPELIEKFQNGQNVQLEDLIAALNPATAGSVPELIIQLMPHLTGEQIEKLAEAYPNKPTGNSYLVLMDTKIKGRQAFPLSTWQNLATLRKIGGEAAKSWVALNFTIRHNQGKKANTIQASLPTDISKNEITNQPGIVTGAQQKAAEVGTNENSGAGQAATAQQQAQQPAAGANPDNAALNANNEGGEFEELKVPGVQQNQQQGNAINSGRAVVEKPLTAAQQRKAAEKAAKDAGKNAGK